MGSDGVWSIIMASLVTSAWVVARIVRGPIGEAIARRIGGTGSAGPEHEAELADMRARVAELEERVEFTERVLLQERPQGELGSGGRP